MYDKQTHQRQARSGRPWSAAEINNYVVQRTDIEIFHSVVCVTNEVFCHLIGGNSLPVCIVGHCSCWNSQMNGSRSNCAEVIK